MDAEFSKAILKSNELIWDFFFGVIQLSFTSEIEFTTDPNVGEVKFFKRMICKQVRRVFPIVLDKQFTFISEKKKLRI